jgi:hypothetical protein
MPICRLRVVCGQGETAAIFVPSNRLISVDLPTFGLPITATKPDRYGGEACSMLPFYQNTIWSAQEKNVKKL